MTPYVFPNLAGLPNPAFGTNDVFRLNRLRDGNLPSSQRSVDRWFDVAAFALSAQGTYGNSGRNVLRAPGFANLDLLIGRNFSISESKRLELRGEFFNFTNSVHLGRPNTRVNDPLGAAGTITDTASPNRQVQIGLRLVF
ncbi:MAG: hypothetical protein HY650_02740 [Acidobacteria bacterium]|nr:hypothetical protein [Acidobacteriota bacterium]